MYIVTGACISIMGQIKIHVYTENVYQYAYPMLEHYVGYKIETIWNVICEITVCF